MGNLSLEEKITRISELRVTLLHQTNLDNAISALKHGLMPKNELDKRRIKYSSDVWGFVDDVPSYFPDDISICQNKGNIKDILERAKLIVEQYGDLYEHNFWLSLGRSLHLIIDPKYSERLKPTPDFPNYEQHHLFRGIIPPEDIIGMLVPIPFCLENVPTGMEEGTEYFTVSNYKFSFENLIKSYELQRDIVSSGNFVPVFYYHMRTNQRNSYIPFLYLAEWLKVSPRIRAEAEEIEEFKLETGVYEK